MKSRIVFERLRDLQSITDAALAFLPLEDLLNELLARVVEILGVDTAAILLLDEDDTTLVARAARGLEEEVESGSPWAAASRGASPPRAVPYGC